ncbi:MAG TPA: hypothetical protein VFF65_08830 [Phycisphaerales bacterium]|nr:hypothetical protein [Phycisphaerales bacterium]
MPQIEPKVAALTTVDAVPTSTLTTADGRYLTYVVRVTKSAVPPLETLACIDTQDPERAAMKFSLAFHTSGSSLLDTKYLVYNSLSTSEWWGIDYSVHPPVQAKIPISYGHRRQYNVRIDVAGAISVDGVEGWTIPLDMASRLRKGETTMLPAHIVERGDQSAGVVSVPGTAGGRPLHLLVDYKAKTAVPLDITRVLRQAGALIFICKGERGGVVFVDSDLKVRTVWEDELGFHPWSIAASGRYISGDDRVAHSLRRPTYYVWDVRDKKGVNKTTPWPVKWLWKPPVQAEPLGR